MEMYERLQGAIDLHVHASPDVFRERLIDEIELAKQARNVGMRAVVLKCHHALTSDRAYLVRKIVSGIEVFGGICLNRAVGGLNPYAVRSAIKFASDQPLCKIVWMPTLDATNFVRNKSLKGNPYYDQKIEDVSIFWRDSLVPEAEEILNIIADHNVILATGHLSVEETKKLVEEAKNAGVKKILVNHPEMNYINMSIEDQKEVAQRGAYLEHCLISCCPMSMHTTPAKIAEAIKTVGARQCVMSTDFGQVYNATPIEGLRSFINLMIMNQISDLEIELMVKKNPAKLLGLK